VEKGLSANIELHHKIIIIMENQLTKKELSMIKHRH